MGIGKQRFYPGTTVTHSVIFGILLLPLSGPDFPPLSIDIVGLNYFIEAFPVLTFCDSVHQKSVQ